MTNPIWSRLALRHQTFISETQHQWYQAINRQKLVRDELIHRTKTDVIRTERGCRLVQIKVKFKFRFCIWLCYCLYEIRPGLYWHWYRLWEGDMIVYSDLPTVSSRCLSSDNIKKSWETNKWCKILSRTSAYRHACKFFWIFKINP